MSDRIEDRKAVLTYVQLELAKVGLYGLKVDGLWGKGTRDGLRQSLKYTGIDVPPGDKVDRLLAYFVQTQSLYSGRCLKLDGWWGPDTEAAFDYLSGELSNNWKDNIEGTTKPLNDTVVWPTQAAVRDGTSLFGMPGAHNLTRFESPFPMRLAWDTSTVVHTISCHAQIRDYVIEALEMIKAAYDIGTIQALGIDLYGGCYSDRAVRNGTRKSMHAWGIAFDFNPQENRLKWNHRRAAFAQSEYEPMMRAWYEVGAINLGRELDYDWMHFQFAKLR